MVLLVRQFHLPFPSVSDLYIYDIDPLKSKDSLEDIHCCDYVFVCVPTPMFKDGTQDLSYVKNVFKQATNKPIYILKSTIIPGTTKKIVGKIFKI